MKPRIFLGSSGQQERLLQALTRGLQDVADVDPWTTVFNPGVSTLDRLVELTREVDFAAFVFAQDDWTTKGASPDAASGQASPRDNVVFEAGLFGGALGIRRTFILHANGAKLPTDLLGLTSIRYDPDPTPAIVRQVNQKLRKAIEAEGRISRLEGDWWQLSLTARTELEPSAVSLLTISRDRAGALAVAGRSWQADGTLSARYWSEASKERVGPAGIFYFWKGERPRHPNAPQLEGTGEIKLESVDRAGGYFTTRSDGADAFHARTSGIYLRADPGDMAVLDGNDAAERAALIERRLEEWKSWANPDPALAAVEIQSVGACSFLFFTRARNTYIGVLPSPYSNKCTPAGLFRLVLKPCCRLPSAVSLLFISGAKHLFSVCSETGARGLRPFLGCDIL